MLGIFLCLCVKTVWSGLGTSQSGVLTQAMLWQDLVLDFQLPFLDVRKYLSVFKTTRPTAFSYSSYSRLIHSACPFFFKFIYLHVFVCVCTHVPHMS